MSSPSTVAVASTQPSCSCRSAACSDSAEERTQKREQLVETAGSIAWFAMDACWMMNLPTAAIALAVPSVILSMMVLGFAARSWSTWLVNAAMAAWTCMNVLWMMHDLKTITWGLTAGRGFLALGGVLVTAALIIGRNEAVQFFFSRLRLFGARA